MKASGMCWLQTLTFILHFDFEESGFFTDYDFFAGVKFLIFLSWGSSAMAGICLVPDDKRFKL